MGLVIGIDASRNRSGGAKAHLIGILTECDPLQYGIREVHVWTFRSLLDSIPNRSWLIKHNPNELQKSLPKQLWWQANKLAHEASILGCDILFSTDASTLCRFDPMVVMSQDMLPYEPGEMQRLGYSIRRFRHIILTIIQNRAMIAANGVIFLTEYASTVIQETVGAMIMTATIPHGIDPVFKSIQKNVAWPDDCRFPIKLLYISNAAPYKHNWVVVKAVEILRNRGRNVRIQLVGGGTGIARSLLDKQISLSDPHRTFVDQKPFVNHKDIPSILSEADVFIFASSCENMPVTLLEAMAIGIPIACSSRGPMPEILGEGGLYFDPEDFNSIAVAIDKIIENSQLREQIVLSAKKRAEQFSWNRCSTETLKFISKVANMKSITMK